MRYSSKRVGRTVKFLITAALVSAVFYLLNHLATLWSDYTAPISYQKILITPKPRPDGWWSFVNSEYGYALNYPLAWAGNVAINRDRFHLNNGNNNSFQVLQNLPQSEIDKYLFYPGDGGPLIDFRKIKKTVVRIQISAHASQTENFKALFLKNFNPKIEKKIEPPAYTIGGLETKEIIINNDFYGEYPRSVTFYIFPLNHQISIKIFYYDPQNRDIFETPEGKVIDQILSSFVVRDS